MCEKHNVLLASGIMPLPAYQNTPSAVRQTKPDPAKRTEHIILICTAISCNFAGADGGRDSSPLICLSTWRRGASRSLQADRRDVGQTGRSPKDRSRSSSHGHPLVPKGDNSLRKTCTNKCPSIKKTTGIETFHAEGPIL